MLHFCTKSNEFGVKGVEWGLDLFPCQKGGIDVDMRVLAQISPILLFPDTFRVKLYPPKQIRGGLEFCPKGLSAWACLLGKNGAFPETLETSFLAIT
jgi:hypothetical protein